MNKAYLIHIILAGALFSGCIDPGNANAKDADNITTTIKITTTTSSTTTSSTTTSTYPTTTTSTTTSSSTTTSTTTTTTIPAEEENRVEVVMFYPPSPCDNCKRVAALAEETISTYYLDELASGKLTYRQALLVDPADRDVVRKYGASSASLWMGTYVNGTFYKEIRLGVWYRTSNREEYMDYLRGYIDKRLAGDMS